MHRAYRLLSISENSSLQFVLYGPLSVDLDPRHVPDLVEQNWHAIPVLYRAGLVLLY